MFLPTLHHIQKVSERSRKFLQYLLKVMGSSFLKLRDMRYFGYFWNQKKKVVKDKFKKKKWNGIALGCEIV